MLLNLNVIFRASFPFYIDGKERLGVPRQPC